MRHKLWFILILCFWISPAAGQIRFEVDWAPFRGKADTSYLEIYYSVDRQSFTHKKVDDGFLGAFRIRTRLLQHQQVFYNDSLFIEDRVQSQDEIKPGQTFAEISQLMVPSGEVVLQTEVTDLVTNKSLTIVDSLSVMRFPEDDFYMSSIELSSRISVQPQREQPFDKNGLRVIPHASGLYGKAMPRLYYYVETYNFSISDDANENRYQARYRIKTRQGKTIQDVPGRKTPKPGKTAVIYGSLDISELKNGAYTLQIDVTDLQTDKVARSEKNFVIYNPEEAEQSVEKVATERYLATYKRYQQMTEEELDHYFKQLSYLATSDEKKIYKELNKTGKQNFIVEFWIKRDPVPETPKNELELKYTELLDYANETYITGVRKGWESDRGRVLLLYGKPDSKEIQQAGVETKAYEVWQYYRLENGVIFVFVDKRRNGDFELVHSTKRGEIYEPDWQILHAQP